MSPANPHEHIKTTLVALFESYADDMDIPIERPWFDRLEEQAPPEGSRTG